MAAGINNTFRQVGIATGIAGLGAIFQARTEAKASHVMEASGVAPAKAHEFAHLIATQHVQDAIHQAGNAQVKVVQSIGVSFISALNEILLVASVLAFAGAALGLLLVRGEDFAHGAEPEAEPVAAAA
jgi:hypothetical protein